MAVNNTRSDHAACREAEMALHQHNLTSDSDSYCIRLGNFLHAATSLEMPAGSTRDEAVQYVKEAADQNICGGSKVTELDNGCTAQESALADKKAECTVKQGTFERAFCNWKSVLESNWGELDTCHSGAVTAYNTHVATRRTLVEKWNIETAALKKIHCHCDVWLSGMHGGSEGDSRSKHNATQFEVCKLQTHTPDPVNYGTPPAKPPCLLTSVEDYPGTSGFITKEYGSFTDFVETVVPCTEATTEAPTTEAPTTEGRDLYTFGEKGMLDGCPLGYSGIFGATACKQAADDLGYYMRSGTSKHGNAYPGCYFYESSKMAYFNTHPDPDGTWHTANAGQICMLEAATAAPSPR